MDFSFSRNRDLAHNLVTVTSKKNKGARVQHGILAFRPSDWVYLAVDEN
jgi:hypothetical protein